MALIRIINFIYCKCERYGHWTSGLHARRFFSADCQLDSRIKYDILNTSECGFLYGR